MNTHRLSQVVGMRKGLLALGLTVAFVLSPLVARAVPIPPASYYTDVVGGGIGPVVLGANDDGSTGSTALGYTLNYFGTDYTTFFINNNGNVTFGGSLGTFTPFGTTTSTVPIIAPYFADVDTRGGGSGLVHLRSDPNQVIVTWDGGGYFNSHVDKLAFFQLVLRGPGYAVPADEGQIGFFYKTVDWETGDASGGIGGFGGTEAAVGFGDGLLAVDPNEFMLPGSLSPGISGTVENTHLWFNLTGGVPAPVPGVPEPGTLLLLGSGLVGLAWYRRKQR